MKIYKKYSTPQYSLIIVVMVLISACSQPFKDVRAILSNNYLSHRIVIQVLNANTTFNNVATDAVVTLSGTAVSEGLIYESGGELLNETPGSLKIANGNISLAIKPYVVISPTKPITFTINIVASGYVSTSKEIAVRSIDSLQYVKIPMVEIASAPVGVTVKQQPIIGVSAGVLPAVTIINVGSNVPNQNAALITIPANTTFKNVTGATIVSNETLSLTAVHFSSASAAALLSIPVGIKDVSDDKGNRLSFVMGGAVNLNMMLGTTPIKSFSTPLVVDVNINNQSINPNTGTAVKAGDVMDVWSNSNGSSVWVKEGSTTVVAVGGRLMATMSVTHLSTWMVALESQSCTSVTKITYNSNTPAKLAHYVAIHYTAGDQFIDGRVVELNNNDLIDIKLPINTACTIKLYEGSSNTTPLVSTVNIAPCATTASLTYNLPADRPTLKFDLETFCSDGIQSGTFRYTGPIQYRISTSKEWLTFTPSFEGKLSTVLLEWDKVYSFQINYNKEFYGRSRKVSKVEFRQQGVTNIWDFWAVGANAPGTPQQTFFPVPIFCK